MVELSGRENKLKLLELQVQVRKGIGDISLGTLECREEGVGVAAVGPRAQNGHLIIHLFDLQSYGLIPWSHIQSFTFWSQIQGLTVWSPIQLLNSWSQSQGLPLGHRAKAKA